MEGQSQEQIGILDWMQRAWRKNFWARCIGVFLAGAVLVALSFLETEFYAAEVKLVYVENSTMPLGALASMDATAVALQSLGLGDAGGAVMLPELLRSRSLLSGVLRDSVDFDGRTKPLFEVYLGDSEMKDSDFEKTLDSFRRTYLDAFYDNRTGVVRLRILAPSPTLASDTANEISDRLNDRLIANATEHARRQRAFIEDRLEHVGEDLRVAELDLKRFREENRAIQSSPALRLEETRLARKMILNEQIFTTLSAQYELARIEEVKNLPVIDVIDAAVPPYVKAMPRRSFRLVAGLFLALIAIATWDAVRFWRAAGPVEV